MESRNSKGGNSPMRRQGSMRKVLHSSEGHDSMMCVSAKILERSEQKNQTAHAYSNFFQDYSFISEFKMTEDHLHPGMFVIPSAYSKFLWFGVIFIHSGIYRGGVFRFSIHLSKGFPDSKCPRILFETPVFHPSIDEESQELDLSEFSDWHKGTNHIWQLLDYLYKIFYDFDTSSVVNTNSLQMYLKNKDEFDKTVQKCVETSQTSILEVPTNDDPHYFKFEKYRSEVHGTARQMLTSTPVQENNNKTLKRGYSWMQNGQTFSKPFL